MAVMFALKLLFLIAAGIVAVLVSISPWGREWARRQVAAKRTKPCVYCERQVPADAEACPRCGKKLPVPKSVAGIVVDEG